MSTAVPEAIFFDMDGLLVDTEPYWLATESELMAEFNVNWTEEDQLYCLGGPMAKVGNYMFELANYQQSPQWFVEELVERVAKKFMSISLMPGVASLLNECQMQKIPSALVSASPRRLVNAVLEAVPNHPFAHTISADDVLRGKPHPDPYFRAAELLNVDIGRSIILEDSPTGVTAARASGAWVIAVPHIATIAPAPKIRMRISPASNDASGQSAVCTDSCSAVGLRDTTAVVPTGQGPFAKASTETMACRAPHAVRCTACIAYKRKMRGKRKSVSPLALQIGRAHV